jgi:hypothetical protein
LSGTCELTKFRTFSSADPNMLMTGYWRKRGPGLATHFDLLTVYPLLLLADDSSSTTIRKRPPAMTELSTVKARCLLHQSACARSGLGGGESYGFLPSPAWPHRRIITSTGGLALSRSRPHKIELKKKIAGAFGVGWLEESEEWAAKCRFGYSLSNKGFMPFLVGLKDG